MADTYQILVVDDDFSIVNIIETALKQAGYQVLTAHDGEAACHIVNTKQRKSMNGSGRAMPMLWKTRSWFTLAASAKSWS